MVKAYQFTTKCTRSSAMATHYSIEKSLQSMNDLDIHPRSSQLLLLNGYTAYHFMFVDCCFNVFILDRFQDATTFEVNVTACDLTYLLTLRIPSFLTTKLKLQAMCTF